MKGSKIAVRGCRLGLAFVIALSMQVNPAMAAPSNPYEASLIPIDTSNVNRSLIDELFPATTPVRRSSTLTANPPAKARASESMTTITKSNISGDFQCNLFESVPYNDILSAVNALSAAVTSPACSGESRVNVQGIIDNNKTVASMVKDLRGFVENPDTIQHDNAAEISNKVDLAIRAATSIANSFAQTDALKKECRETMSAGQIATSINDVINGLTPYALMAATLTTGGAAAVPFIVGGSIATGVVSSVTKIINEDKIKIEKAEVRRAIVENTCQFIRLDQKYKFLIKSRQEQIAKITTDLNASQKLFSAKIGGLSNNTSELVVRKNALMVANKELTTVMASSRGQLDLDKQFMNSTTDSIKICQLGIQLSILAKDKSSYVSKLLGTLDPALAAYGTTNVAQAQALKTSGALAMKALAEVAENQFSGNVNYAACAQNTKSFVETIDQSASLAKQLVKLSQESIERGLQGNNEYKQYSARLSSINQKKYQAERVTNSLDKLQAYANKITQSEIDAEMNKVRGGLFGEGYFTDSPVIKWFKYVNGLHKGEVTRFLDGLDSLRKRSYKMTASGSAMPTVPLYRGYEQLHQKQIARDRKIAKNLENFTLKTLPLGTKEHENVCRELNDVWGHWTAALDHLGASDAFCNMIEPYVYDNRSEDKSLVKMCRGYSKNAMPAQTSLTDLPSTIGSMKNALVKEYTRDWALRIKTRMSQLACVDLNANPN